MQPRTLRPGWMSPQLWEAWTFRAETPSGPPTSGQEPTAGAGQAPTSPASGQASETTHSLAEVQAALQAARREAAASRKKLDALEQAQATADAAKLSDLEKAQKRAADLEAENTRIRSEAQATVTNARIERHAAQLGAVDPELVTRLINPDEIERDAAGIPTNLDALVKQVLKARPYLVAAAAGAAPAPQAGATNPATGRGVPALTLADVQKMSPAQINARWAEVQKALAAGV